ncbi:type II secretion system protein GspK [Yersinia enterocolitica]|uniref:General secretion pathway protein K n=1 Tax=Yersinia enterocolitica serotype O:8 / biotype 1B (strain NCTC 13174 / 8081) TaxID=393305 RepID=A1JPG8_YERE8|nr:type II secretion system protein GspK [Yersinia enterocolitica]CAL13372.1 general secretion pathway protein K [Yersinia enterocolitica subsp. enterocolitica 8081]HDL8281468.1 general secretion pathway protein GspK [Yersinia enterocolitica]HDM8291335.1 general secretion pathway protein GspK [Yersinia enterocolitica]HDM8295464.1 general secretion pathway protein GspK [Yersinia enterocolitica]HDM8320521.1 general secretion pathway protein GspK [Yersinia enterocolitica]
MKQRGIALLLVLSSILLMSTMISATYLYLSNMIYFVGNSIAKQDDKQLLLGSEGFFLNNIAKEILNGEDFGGTYSKLLTSNSAISINNRDVYYSLIDRTSCFNVNTLYDSFGNMNNKYYPWLVLDNILQLNNTVSSVINKLMTMFAQYPADASDLDRIDRDFLTIGQAFLRGNSIDKILNISSESFLYIAPLVCSRNDNKLLINVNMLNAKSSYLLQAIFMNEITGSDVYKVILSKPAQGWLTVESFFESLANNSSVDIDRINELKNVEMLKFSNNEYYFSSNFKVDNGDSQLMSLFHVKGNTITVLHRRFIL